MMELSDRKLKDSLEFYQKELPVFFDTLNIDINGKKIADVGAGIGATSLVMKEMGADVTIVEPSTDRVVNTLTKNFEEDHLFLKTAEQFIDERSDQFDIVTLFDIYSYDMGAMLEAAARMTTDNGILLVGADEGQSEIASSILKDHFHRVQPIYDRIADQSEKMPYLSTKMDAFYLAQEPLFRDKFPEINAPSWKTSFKGIKALLSGTVEGEQRGR